MSLRAQRVPPRAHLVSPLKPAIKVSFSSPRPAQEYDVPSSAIPFNALTSPYKDLLVKGFGLKDAPSVDKQKPWASVHDSLLFMLLFIGFVLVISGITPLLLTQQPGLAVTPSCHWSWKVGCVASNEATTSCAPQFPRVGDLDLCKGL